MATFEPKQFGRFYLLEKLAVGGMAEIYKAKTYGAEGFEKLLAIKRILPHCSADKEFITMLIDEAKLSVLLSHANVVQVYDLGKVGEDYFISMEYLNAVNLRDILYRCREQERQIPPELALYIMSEICKGLDYAHRKSDSNGKPLGIVHRDVSPQNVLISYEGEVKLVDFGIAKAAMNISHTMAGILKGKIAYMSPEQALGKSIDHRTDIFSVGIILYECLIGKKLFTGESQFEVLKKIRTTRLTRDTLPATLPLPLREILAKTLAYLPKDRFISAGDLQTGLTRLLYSTYVDFTPQRLAAFVRELFSDELQRQHDKAVARHQRERQTESVSFMPSGVQQNIVHRPEVTDPRARAESEHTPGRGTVPLPPERSVNTVEDEPRRLRTRLIAIGGTVVVLLGIALGYFQWIHPHVVTNTPVATIPPPEPVITPPTVALPPIEPPPTTAPPSVATAPATIEMPSPAIPPAVTPPETGPKAITGPELPLDTTPTPPVTIVTPSTTPPTPAPTKTAAPATPTTPPAVKAQKPATTETIKKTPAKPQEPTKTATPTPSKPAKTPTTKAPVPTEASIPHVASGLGSIVIDSKPKGATVFVDGRKFGRAPLTIRGIASGSRQIRVEMKGYSSWSQSVSVENGKERFVKAALQPLE